MLPNDDPRPEEAGYAAGGIVSNTMGVGQHTPTTAGIYRHPGDPGTGRISSAGREREEAAMGVHVNRMAPWTAEDQYFARGGPVRGYAGGGWIIEQQGHPLGRSSSSSSSSEMSEEDSNWDMQGIPGGSVGTGQSTKKSMKSSHSNDYVGWKEGGAVTKGQTRGRKDSRPGFDAGGMIPTGSWTSGNYGVDATPRPGGWTKGIGAAGMRPDEEKAYMKPDWAPAQSRPVGARPDDNLESTGFHIRGGRGMAQGGSVAKGPGFDIDYSSPRQDPVARRRYSPKHVGYAGGGDVEQDGYGYWRWRWRVR